MLVKVSRITINYFKTTIKFHFMSLNTKTFLNNLFDKLYPLNRTICGKGYDESLNILKKS
jgi:aminopeptidase-like protein